MPYIRSEEHTSELQSHDNLVCRLLLEKKKKRKKCNETIGSEAEVWSTSSRAAPLSYRSLPLCPSTPPIPLLCFPTFCFFFFFNDTATTEIYTLSLHDALPI